MYMYLYTLKKFQYTPLLDKQDSNAFCNTALFGMLESNSQTFIPYKKYLKTIRVSNYLLVCM